MPLELTRVHTAMPRLKASQAGSMGPGKIVASRTGLAKHEPANGERSGKRQVGASLFQHHRTTLLTFLLPPPSAMFFLFGSVLLISLLSAQFSSAAVKRAGLTSLAASTSLNAIAYPLQRTPDGGAYLLNVSFPASDGYTVPLKIDLSSPKTWANTPSTYCWNLGNLPGLTGGSCGATAPEPSCQGAPQRMVDYYTSENVNLWGKSCSAKVALGPVEIACQNLIYAEQTWIQPDEVSAGVLGLAYPELIDTAFSQLSPSPGEYMNL
jgi:hypothetical protein